LILRSVGTSIRSVSLFVELQHFKRPNYSKPTCASARVRVRIPVVCVREFHQPLGPYRTGN
jgi:hypothetical protein